MIRPPSTHKKTTKMRPRRSATLLATISEKCASLHIYIYYTHLAGYIWGSVGAQVAQGAQQYSRSNITDSMCCCQWKRALISGILPIRHYACSNSRKGPNFMVSVRNNLYEHHNKRMLSIIERIIAQRIISFITVCVCANDHPKSGH